MIIPPETRLKQLAEYCTVLIPGRGVAGGSGFFVAPRLIVSCAHVVAGPDGIAARTVQVIWNEQAFDGQVEARPPLREAAEIWPYPDLAVITLDVTPDDQLYAILGDFSEESSSNLYLCGYTQIYDTRTPRFHSTPAKPGGRQDVAGGRAWQLYDCEMAHGVSGGPVLDLSSGLVCAIAKTTRAEGTSLGGLAIPIGALREHFPQVWQRNREVASQATDWTIQIRALRDKLAPGGLLPEHYRRCLAAAADELDLQRSDLNALWQEITGARGADLSGSLEDLQDLAFALADLEDGGLAVAKLFELLAYWPDKRLKMMRQYARDLARQSGKYKEFRHFRRHRSSSGKVNLSQPIFVIRLETFWSEPDHGFGLTIWRYLSEDGEPVQVHWEQDPLPVDEIEDIVVRILAAEIVSLPAKPMLEFALPDLLLDVAVEDWRLYGRPIGPVFPVVVRFETRQEQEHTAWRWRGKEIKAAKLPTLRSPSWTELWIGCDDRRSAVELSNMFEVNSHPPLLAMTGWHSRRGESVPRAIQAVRMAGVPVMVWQHKPCADHRRRNGEVAADCRGHRFREALTDSLSDLEFRTLPEAVWQMRARAGARQSGSEHGQHVAILWDDPDRVPWAAPVVVLDPNEQR